MADYLGIVKTFADNVIARGRDTYGPVKTPLFVDGINVDTLEPPVWKRDGQKWVISNQASQQNLMRVLDSLSEITGDDSYRQAAIDAVRYALQNVRDVSGMLYWGGHTFYDALGDRIVGESRNHEYKRHYPHYDLMWRVDPQATREHIEAVWAGHIIDWDTLDFNRHARYDQTYRIDWDRTYAETPVPFAGKGLTFMMTAMDLAYAAAALSRFTRDERPLVWAKRLVKRYMDARHRETGLGACNFSYIDPDRMNRQFPQFGGRFTEATVTDIYGARYTFCSVGLLRLAELLGTDGPEFLQWALEDLAARATHFYDEQSNSFGASLIDGTPLNPADRLQDGYVTVKWLESRPADGRHFLAYALAYRLSKSRQMWQMAVKIGRGLGLTALPDAAGGPLTAAVSTDASDPLLMFGLLELAEATGDSGYLDLADAVAGKAISLKLQKGFFAESQDHIFAKFDDPLPLALLHLYAARTGSPLPPRYWLSTGYFHCTYDGAGRTYDRMVIYPRLRGEPEP